jgi:F-type H+-transporting ATPase subunit a
VATPVSMSIRHFGNIASGIVITQLLYFALTMVSNAIGLNFPVFTIGVPAVLSVYFDLFTGFMQAFVFTMLTMANVGSAYPEPEN